MLNEIAEYENYRKIEDPEKKGSLQPFITRRNLNNGFSGMQHILEVLARGLLWTDGKKQDELNAALLKWFDCFSQEDMLLSACRCGNNTEESPDSKGKLTFPKESKFKFFKEQCSKPLYDLSGKDNLNHILFEKIKASALQKGPLHNYVLLAKEDFFKDKNTIVKRKSPDNATYKLSNTERNYLMRLTAVYLMERKYSNNCASSIHIVKSEILNWEFCGELSYDEFWFSDDLTAVNQSIKVNNSIYKTRFSDKWINNFCIVDYNEVNTKKADGFVLQYVDKGPGIDFEKSTV